MKISGVKKAMYLYLRKISDFPPPDRRGGVAEKGALSRAFPSFSLEDLPQDGAGPAQDRLHPL